MTEQTIMYEGRFAVANEGFRALYQLAHATSTMRTVFAIYRDAGIRDFLGYSLEKTHDGEMGVVDRSGRRGFRNMSEHGIAAALASDEIGNLVGFDRDLKTEFNTEVALHDVGKRIEVVTMGFRKIAQKRTADRDQMKVLADTLFLAGIANDRVADIVHSLKELPVMDFFRFVNEEINRPFLGKMFDRHALPFSDRQRFIDVASADSADLLPLLLARVAVLTKDMPADDPVMYELRGLSERLRMQDLLPSVAGDLTDTLGALLWYADSVTKHNVFTTISDRFADVVARGDYAEVDAWGRLTFNGPSYYQVNRLVNHATERWIVRQGVKRGMLDHAMNPHDLPKVIMQNLQTRVAPK